MASNGIKDQVAIVAVNCTPFGEHWDKSADDLLVEATEPVFAQITRMMSRAYSKMCSVIAASRAMLARRAYREDSQG